MRRTRKQVLICGASIAAAQQRRIEMNIRSLLMIAAALTAVLACVAAESSTSAQTEQRSVRAKNRPDPAKYPLKIWSKNSLGMGQSVSAMTPLWPLIMHGGT